MISSPPDVKPISPLEETSFRLMRMIEQNPNVSQRELAKAAGVSLGKTHYVLKALAERGYIKLERFNASKNKRAYTYVLTPRGLARKASITRTFLAKKRAEYDALKVEIEQLACELESQKKC